jgi:hypothetical protein
MVVGTTRQATADIILVDMAQAIVVDITQIGKLITLTEDTNVIRKTKNNKEDFGGHIVSL